MPFQKKPPEIKCALSCNAAPFFEKPARLFFAPASEARFWASKRRLFASKKRLFAPESDTSGACTFLRLFFVEKAFILQKSGNYDGPKTKRQLKTPQGDSRYIHWVSRIILLICWLGNPNSSHFFFWEMWTRIQKNMGLKMIWFFSNNIPYKWWFISSKLPYQKVKQKSL